MRTVAFTTKIDTVRILVARLLTCCIVCSGDLGFLWLCFDVDYSFSVFVACYGALVGGLFVCC